MSELSEYLQSVPSHELTKKVASEFSELGLTYRPRRMVVQEFILLAKQFMTDFFAEIRPELETHVYNYPFLRIRIPWATYDSTGGRVNYQRVQSLIRKIPAFGKRLYPRPIGNPVVPIILPGVDYSAESLVSSDSLETDELPAKPRLGWHHLDADADYCLGLMAIGRETYSSLVDAWYYANDSDWHFKGLETLSEEMLHHISDEIAGPRYSALSANKNTTG